MKLALLLSIISFTIYGQNKKFIFDVSYGISYSKNYHSAAKMLPSDSRQNLDMQAKNWGTALNVNLEYKLLRDGYVGIGYLNQISQGTVNESFYDIKQDNFITSNFLQIYDVHYSKYLERIALTGGLFWYTDKTNGISFDSEDGITMKGYTNKRGDNLGLFASLGYQYPIYEYLNVGIRLKSYYCVFEGFTTTTFSPFVAFKF